MKQFIEASFCYARGPETFRTRDNGHCEWFLYADFVRSRAGQRYAKDLRAFKLIRDLNPQLPDTSSY